MQIFDVSVPIRTGMVHYEGNPPVELVHGETIAEGANANVSRLDFGVHSGTHVDAPLHFFDEGAGTETLPLEVLIGPAEVVDATGVKDVLDEKALRKLELPLGGSERVIFKTRNSQLWERKEFTRDFVRLDGSGARFLLERGARLIGIDYLSVGDMDAHRLLLGARVVPLEGLDLRGIEPGTYQLVCLPLRIVGSDGAPARAVLIRE
ncbi:MAG: cyclase family protein [Gaiellaceae bacterium]